MTDSTSPTPAEHTALRPIENDLVHLKRSYIPLPAGWEMQTKGGGSTYRLAHVRGPDDYDRWAVLDTHLHEPLEQMARDIHASYSAAVNERAGLLERVRKLEEALRKIDKKDTEIVDGGAIRDAAGGIIDAFETEEIVGPFAAIARAALQPAQETA